MTTTWLQDARTRAASATFSQDVLAWIVGIIPRIVGLVLGKAFWVVKVMIASFVGAFEEASRV